jgi:hypothetical protein
MADATSESPASVEMSDTWGKTTPLPCGEELTIDTTKPHPARMYDYYLDGKDNFVADREAAAGVLKSFPHIRVTARENRAFLGRAVRYLAAECGVRQFLDIGTGIPTAGNTHEVAQSIAPDARVVYVDNDPIVLAHARALLTSSTVQGATSYIDADLREPEKIIERARAILDFSQPVAIMLIAILHFAPDDWNPRGILDTLLDAVPAGSYLVASHVTPEHDPEGWAGVEEVYHQGGIPLQTRTAEEFEELAFTGLTEVPPGVVLVSEWRRPENKVAPSPAEVSCYGGIARKS